MSKDAAIRENEKLRFLNINMHLKYMLVAKINSMKLTQTLCEERYIMSIYKKTFQRLQVPLNEYKSIWLYI